MLRCRLKQDKELTVKLAGLAIWKMNTAFRVWDKKRPGEFIFLNQSIHLGYPPRWNVGRRRARPADAHLWEFQLHYFDWIWDALRQGARLQAMNMMKDWIAKAAISGTGLSRSAWSPYTTSLRLRNWIIATQVLRDAKLPVEDLEHSICQQYLYLARNLEFEHGGNHLLENLITLSFAGRCLTGNNTLKIRSSADRLLQMELSRQFLPDGCHVERSPMYQAILLNHLCDLVAIVDPGDPLANPLIQHIRNATAFLTHLTTPDGCYPLLSDSAGGMHPDVLAIKMRASGLCGEATHDPGEGSSVRDSHVVFRAHKSGDFVLFDAGPIGEDSLGAHMHADVLGYELWLAGKHLVADGGAGFYAAGSRRTRSRSAQEHASLKVDGAECAEPWKSFRMGRRPRVSAPTFRKRKNGFTASCSHDGFRIVGATHHREVTFDESKRRLTVTDVLKSAKPEVTRWPVEIRIPLHPDIQLLECSPGKWSLQDIEGNAIALLVMPEDCTIRIENGIYFEAFGKGRPRSILIAKTLLHSGQRFTYGFHTKG